MAARAGDYHIHRDTLLTGARLLLNSARTSLIGMPRHPGSCAEIARGVLRANAGPVLLAGSGHFRYFWIADFGKSIRGLLRVLPRSYLLRQALRILEESERRGNVPTCMSEDRSFDLPYPRADGLPWLVHAFEALEPEAFRVRKEAFLTLVDRYLQEHLDRETGLLHAGVRGDWMDTIRRPSSTYNNLLLLHMLRVLSRNGILPTDHELRAERVERALVDSRWTGTHFTDFHGSGDYLSADANAPALYLELFDSGKRARIVDSIESSSLLRPVPMRISETVQWEHMPLFTRVTPKYHSSAWLHMGLLYVAGLAAHDRPETTGHLARIERVVEEHGNFVEVIDDDGRPYRTLFHATEHGLTMAAALYVEASSALAQRPP